MVSEARRSAVPLACVTLPATAKEAGQCCQPYGRTTMIWGAGKSYPVSGEDFAYQIFRKRNCCAGAY